MRNVKNLFKKSVLVLGFNFFLPSSFGTDGYGKGFAFRNPFTTLGILPIEDVGSLLNFQAETHPLIQEAYDFWNQVFAANQLQMTPKDHISKQAVVEAYRFLKDPGLLPSYTQARFKETVNGKKADAHLAVGPAEFFDFSEARKSEIKRGFFVGDLWIKLSKLITNLDQGLELELSSKLHTEEVQILLQSMRAEVEILREAMLTDLFLRETKIEIIVKSLREGKFRTRSEENILFILDAFFRATPGGWARFDQFSDTQSYLRSIIVEPADHKHLDLALAYFLLTEETRLEKFYANLSFADVMALRYFLAGRKGHLMFLELAQAKAGSTGQIHMALAKYPRRFASWRDDFANWPFFETARKADTPKPDYPEKIRDALAKLERAFFKMKPSPEETHMFQYLSGQVRISPVTELEPGECARVLGQALNNGSIKAPKN